MDLMGFNFFLASLFSIIQISSLFGLNMGIQWNLCNNYIIKRVLEPQQQQNIFHLAWIYQRSKVFCVENMLFMKDNL